MRDGFFKSLSSDELKLYLFLVLAADKDGVSWYGYDKICSLLRLIVDEYINARNALIGKDLIAFDGTVFQVLSLPADPAVLKEEKIVENRSSRKEIVHISEIFNTLLNRQNRLGENY